MPIALNPTPLLASGTLDVPAENDDPWHVTANAAFSKLWAATLASAEELNKIEKVAGGGFVDVTGTRVLAPAVDGRVYKHRVTGDIAFSIAYTDSTKIPFVFWVIRIDGVAGHVVTLPTNLTLHGAGTNDLNLTAGADNFISMFTPDGGASWIGYLDTGANAKLPSEKLSFTGDATVKILFDRKSTMDLDNVVKDGNGTLTFQKKISGTTTAASGKVTLNSGDCLLLTLTGSGATSSAPVAVLVPRTA